MTRFRIFTKSKGGIMKKFIFFVWLLSALYVIYASVIPSPEYPLDFTFADKFYHAMAYFWLTILPVIGFENRQSAFRSMLFAILLGLTLEFVQALIPHRECSFWDFVANTTGAFAGFYLGLYIKPFFKLKIARS
jgi:VanZ family protein